MLVIETDPTAVQIRQSQNTKHPRGPGCLFTLPLFKLDFIYF